MPDRVSPFSLDQIGSGIVRFSSKGVFETHKDHMVNPYAATLLPKEVQVEGVQFWPQENAPGHPKGKFPSVILLHERWGLTSQIKDTAERLACEGYVVLVPNLYGRQGGMVTANEEVANILMERLEVKSTLQDINACCEFLNTNMSDETVLEQTQRNLQAVVGFDLGGALAMRFACQRKRLRAAVAFYGKPPSPIDVLQQLYCPLQYHAADPDDLITQEDMEQLNEAAQHSVKEIDIRTYKNTTHGFCNDTQSKTFHPEAANRAWESTLTFLQKQLVS